MGALVGAVVGDLLGVTYEFAPPSRILVPRLSVRGGGPFKFPPGVGSDDTDLLMVVLDAYDDESRFDADVALQGMLDWYANKPRDVGLRTSESLESWRDLRQPPVDENALGNGGLMRAAAHGIAAPTLFTARTNAADDTRLTHNAKIAADFSAHQATMVWRLINNPEMDPSKVMNSRGLCSPYPVYKSELSGFCVHTLRLAMTALRDAESYEQGIEHVIRTGGDTDTNAAVAGALLGAKFGESAIPADWVAAIDPALRARIEAMREKYKEKETLCA